MEQIELVIRMSKDTYETICNAGSDCNWIISAEEIIHGTLLPKGHGRLIDGDILKNQNCCSESYVKLFTIVEADKEGAEE